MCTCFKKDGCHKCNSNIELVNKDQIVNMGCYKCGSVVNHSGISERHCRAMMKTIQQKGIMFCPECLGIKREKKLLLEMLEKHGKKNLPQRFDQWLKNAK